MSPEEAAAYRRQAEQEMARDLAAIRQDVDLEMANFRQAHGIDNDTDDNEDDNTNISKKDILELIKKIRIRLAGPLPGEPNPNYSTKRPPDNNEDPGHAYLVSAHGGKKNKKKRRRKTKRKRKKKKRKTKRRR